MSKWRSCVIDYEEDGGILLNIQGFVTGLSEIDDIIEELQRARAEMEAYDKNNGVSHHRCKNLQSLEQYDIEISTEHGEWGLWQDCDLWVPIEYCPFCGEKLDKEVAE